MVKIARKTQKVFGSTSGATGVTDFGSTAGGTTVYSTDLDVIQSTKFLQGWLGAILAGTKRLPVYQDMNAIQFVQTTQLAYLFQEGMAEYDVGTEYHQKSIVKKVGTYELWGSVINTNIGNALVEGANWTLLLDLETGTSHVGSYLDLATESVPMGYLECDGSAISRTTYAELFVVISDSYGIGDGATTFNVPDFRGLFPRCMDAGAAVDPGSGTASGLSANTNTSTSITNAPNISLYANRRYIGADISGTDIPANAKIVSWTGTTITISHAATGTSAIVDMAIDFDVVESKQADTFQGHTHKLRASTASGGSVLNLQEAGAYGLAGVAQASSLIFSDTAPADAAQLMLGNGVDGSFGTPLVGVESRPKNMNMMRCIKY